MSTIDHLETKLTRAVFSGYLGGYMASKVAGWVDAECEAPRPEGSICARSAWDTRTGENYVLGFFYRGGEKIDLPIIKFEGEGLDFDQAMATMDKSAAEWLQIRDEAMLAT